MARRLDDVAILAANVFLDFDDDFAVGKPVGSPAAERDIQMLGDPLRQLGWPCR